MQSYMCGGILTLHLVISVGTGPGQTLGFSLNVSGWGGGGRSQRYTRGGFLKGFFKVQISCRKYLFYNSGHLISIFINSIINIVPVNLIMNCHPCSEQNSYPLLTVILC